MTNRRVEIIVSGLVQGVGFRYFVINAASKLGVKGYTKNLMSGEVLTVAEGEKKSLEELIECLRIGPRSAHVKKMNFVWQEFKNEFKNFEVRY